MSSNKGYIVKFIVVGESGVGKTQIIIRYSKNTYNESFKPTIGCELTAMEEKIKETIFRVQVWDTAGSEQFYSLTKAYFRNSACALLVYDISQRETFEKITLWMNDVQASCSEDLIMVLVGNKSDLKEKREVTYNEGLQFANKNKIAFFECSAQNGEGIKEIFISSLKVIESNIKRKVYRLSRHSCCVKDIAEVEEEKKERRKKKDKEKKLNCC